jgi:hypothetical protein
MTNKTTESYGKNANRAAHDQFSLSSTSGDRIEMGNHFRGNLKHRRLKILAKMLNGRCSGDRQDIG